MKAAESLGEGVAGLRCGRERRDEVGGIAIVEMIKKDAGVCPGTTRCLKVCGVNRSTMMGIVVSFRREGAGWG